MLACGRADVLDAPARVAGTGRATERGRVDLGLDGPEETRMPVDVLAIAAHPDDVELTCGGTLAR